MSDLKTASDAFVVMGGYPFSLWGQGRKGRI